jgi:exosortase sorting signal-containing protein
MTNLKRVLLITVALVGFMTIQSYDNAYGWDDFVKTSQLFAVGEVGSEKSYLYTIDPLSGELHMIGDTGLNNCRGLDFAPDGRLMTFCELRDEEGITPKGLEPVAGVAAELNTANGRAFWAVPHGVSSSMSDVAIREDGAMFSIENVDSVNLHTHVDENDFQAMFIGEMGLEALDHGMAFWGADELKVAANVNGPELYDIDTDTGGAQLVGLLGFPDSVVAAANTLSTREIMIEEIQFGSMDKVEIVPLQTGLVTTKAAIREFNEADADFAVLMFKAGAEAENKGLINGPISWAVIGLMDSDTLRVDYIVEILGEADVRAIAVKKREPNPIPTMSEWGLIIMAGVLGIIGLLAARRRAKYGDRGERITAMPGE